ncbi:DUF3299 domain-containing protein [Maricaulis sp.]|jgi:uncharacterized protein|uniref:DUF3299 domain-containing protein n=1 Tax=Maricaulis sp. TaxID=1486257 RepID=UPI0025E3B0D4|nr:DUF3299 domain-containing protein [Maricaulis sp.]MDF1768589.1 DUF3299 domain-containing protein [Maricaulis sp.]
MPKISHILAPLTLFIAACGASPDTARAAQDESGTPPQAATAMPDPAAQTNVDDSAPLRATPPPPGPNLPLPDENGITTINWDHLLPEGEMERIQELYNLASSMTEMDHLGGPMTQIGTFNVQEGLIGRTVRMPGYILPLDLQPGGDITEFLLVPYFGACVHTPPPPPNQIVYVTSAEPIRVERLWSAVWVTGQLTADQHMNDMGDAAYTIELIETEPYRR